MTTYRMPLIEVQLGHRKEYRPKYGNMIPNQYPWRLIKESDRQWAEIAKDNGTVLLEVRSELPADIHLRLASIPDVEVVSR